MALALYTNTSGTITQLNDDTPFRLESAEGLSGSDVVRYEQRGPYQSGVTDLGFHLQARVITLNLLFFASTPALLDTYRATLMAAFKPLDSTSIFLSVTRDDGEIRTLTCFTVGDIDIALDVDEYAAHMHRATVQLRAASPLWKANAVTSGSANFSGLASWWLAGGAIAAGNVKTHTTYPSEGPASPLWSGSITGDWSVVYVTAKYDPAIGVNHYIWQDGTGGSASHFRLAGFVGDYRIAETSTGAGSVSWPGTTDYNYHLVESRSGVNYWRYWTAGSITQWTSLATDISLRGGTFFSWRDSNAGGGLRWTPELRKAAVYGTVTVNQLQALAPYLLDTLTGSVSVVNDGDVYAYPIITMHGPVTNPVIVNTTTSGTLDLTGIVLGSADTMTIDLRDGNKQIYNQNGTNLLGSVTTLPVSIASFALAPSPIASGGTNTLVMTPGSVGNAATFAVQITNQYMSF